ncbi:hypothetical protein [Phocaeicola sp.]
MAKIRLYLDTRKENRTGEYPLVILLSHRATTAHIPLDIRLRKEQWENDEVSGIYNQGHKDRLCAWRHLQQG